jgi:drug/metabolite transporter (DMT)-like permease
MTDDRLTLFQIALLTGYAVGMSGGQVLFKLAALRFTGGGGSIGDQLLNLLQNVPFLVALLLFGGFSVLWVWILSFMPLSRAYPFVAIAFAITPLLGGLLFGEPISARLVAGIIIILGGLFLVTS